MANDVSELDVDDYVVAGDVNGDVVVLLMLLETQFLINLIVVTAFWVFSCDEVRCKLGVVGGCKSEHTAREVALELGATKRLDK